MMLGVCVGVCVCVAAGLVLTRGRRRPYPGERDPGTAGALSAQHPTWRIRGLQ